MDGWMESGMDGWMDCRMNGQVDGWQVHFLSRRPMRLLSSFPLQPLVAFYKLRQPTVAATVAATAAVATLMVVGVGLGGMGWEGVRYHGSGRHRTQR